MSQIQSASEKLDFETHHMLLQEPGMPFADVSAQVKTRAREINKDAMMLSWYNDHLGEGYPNYECTHEKPFWEMFAESRGYNLKIVVNEGEYIFFYLKL